MSKVVTIRGDSRIVGLLGNPVAHSVSPLIHNHAFASLDLPFVYVPMPVTPENLGQVVSALAAVGALGANVALPHKQSAAILCDVLSPLSRKLGTVNTLFFREDIVYGTTTDPIGFLRALAWMGHDAHSGNVVILGNGGTARTIAGALAIDSIPKKITIAGRNRERAESLAKELSALSGQPIVAMETGDVRLRDALSEASLLVNCTSAGLYPNVEETPIDRKFLHKGLTVFDTIYNPEKTRLLQEAEAMGCRVQNGLRMLLYQGLASFSLWTGIDVLEEIFDIEELQRSCTK